MRSSLALPAFAVSVSLLFVGCGGVEHHVTVASELPEVVSDACVTYADGSQCFVGLVAKNGDKTHKFFSSCVPKTATVEWLDRYGKRKSVKVEVESLVRTPKSGMTIVFTIRGDNAVSVTVDPPS